MFAGLGDAGQAVLNLSRVASERGVAVGGLEIAERRALRIGCSVGAGVARRSGLEWPSGFSFELWASWEVAWGGGLANGQGAAREVGRWSF